MNQKQTLKLTYAAACLALAMVLPMITGYAPQIGNALSPMHIPVFLCGFLCGWPYAVVVGLIAPFLRFALFEMPPLYPIGTAMAFELAAYGFLTGFLNAKLPKKTGYLYVTLISAMLGGRVVWGVVRYILAGLQGSTFPFSAFLAGAFTNAIPGIVLHILLVPLIVLALRRAKLA